METELKIVTKPNEQLPYESQVEDFIRLDETTAKYTTYSFNPKMLLEARIAQMRELGASFEIRNISADEVKQLREGVPLDGSDYTVEAIGLAARDIHPELDLYPVAGVLVHYIDRATGQLRNSYMHEDKALYVVTRPSPQGREIVLGGTFMEHVGDVSPDEGSRLAEGIVQNVRGEFSQRGFDLSRLSEAPRDITVGFRPAIKGDPAIQRCGRVSIVTGFSGQGLVTNPAVARLVAEQVGQAAEYFSGISLPPIVDD